MRGWLVMLLGCVGGKDTEDPSTKDQDQDGFVAQYDCDDANPAVYPTAEESCDGIDNNCDGVVDDPTSVDATTWHADADGDGHGNPAIYTTGCTPPPGFVAAAGDCDDSNDAAHPGREEVCDGIDNDCDGQSDNDPTDGAVWYADADMDGYGTDAAVHKGCAPGVDWATELGDCDDSTADVYPGAEEVCGDGWVNDCNTTEAEARALCAWPGVMDEGDASAILSPSGASGQPGWAIDHGDLNGDGQGDLLIGAPGADQAWMMFGPITGARDYGSAEALTGDNPGFSVLSADVNMDGFSDVLTGGSEQTWVVWGPVTAGQSLDTATAWLSVEGAALAAPAAHASGGTLIAVGAPERGAVFVFDGQVDGQPSTDDAWMLSGTANTGAALATAGDLDGDGLDELLIGAPNASSGGCAWLVSGPISADRVLNSGDCWTATGWTSLMGAALSGLGDLDGDGYDDMAIGAPAADFYRGAVGIWHGRSSALSPADITTADIRIDGNLGMLLGGDVHPAGDLDLDGLVDLVVGSGHGIPGGGSAPVNDGPAEAYVFLSTGALQGSRLSTDDADVRVEGPQRAFGLRAHGVGDISGDGRDDLFFSSGEQGEESYLFFGTGE